MPAYDFEIQLKSGEKFQVGIRPLIFECLDKLKEFYEMAIFTAADQEYADLIIDKLDPSRDYFKHRLYR